LANQGSDNGHDGEPASAPNRTSASNLSSVSMFAASAGTIVCPSTLPTSSATGLLLESTLAKGVSGLFFGLHVTSWSKACAACASSGKSGFRSETAAMIIDLSVTSLITSRRVVSYKACRTGCIGPSGSGHGSTKSALLRRPVWGSPSPPRDNDHTACPN